MKKILSLLSLLMLCIVGANAETFAMYALSEGETSTSVFTVAGNAPFFGETEWTISEANDLTKGDDGIYTKTYSGVELTNGTTIMYKVVKNHDWTENWGNPNGTDGNADYTVWEGDGTYDVTFKFNPDGTFSDGLHVACEMTKQPTPITAMAIMGNLPGLSWDLDGAVAMTTEDNNNWTATLENVELPAGDYYCKAIANGNWEDLVLPGKGDNDAYTLKITESGIYNIVFTVDLTKPELTVEPTKVGELADIYSLVGGFYGASEVNIFGGNQLWDYENTASEMTLDELTGLYTWTSDEIELETGRISYQVAKNHSWETQWGYPDNNDHGNAFFDITDAGKYTLTFTFSPTEAIDGDYYVKCTAVKAEEPAPEITSMTIVGEFIGGEPTDEETEPWWNPANGWAMTQDAENPVVWTLTKEFEAEAKTYKYKATANGKYGDYELPAEGDQNFVFGTDEYPAGKYNLTFTANTEEHTLTLDVEAVVPEQNTYTAKFTNNGNWAEVYAYAWSGEKPNVKEFLGEWPGTKLESSDGGYVVTIKAEEAPDFIIFNNNAGLQTGDLAFVDGEVYTYVVPAQTATFNFADPNIRENIGESMTDTKGYIYNETFTAEGASLQITSGSAASRIYVDNKRGQNLVTYKEYTTLTFRAPEGKAITKIEFTAAGSSDINNFTASSGEIEGMTWTGNADGVRFQQGGTSYLANAIVTLEAAGEGTAILPAIEYTDCGNIAAFNALEPGTYAKITLTDAEIIGKSADGYSTVWVQDATGGAWIQYTSLNDKLNEMTKINGVVFTIKRAASGNPHLKEAEATINSEFSAEPINAYTTVEGTTISEVNVPENLNKVVKISGATLEMTSASAGKLTLGEETIDVNNGTETANQQLHKIAEWVKDTKLENITITAILVAKSATANQLLPISIEQPIVSMAIVGDFVTGLEATDEDPEPWWNPANGLAMIQDAENPAIWSLTVEGFEAEAKTYYYKATANGVYGVCELPNPGNADFEFGTEGYPAGKYNLTFTANTEAGYLNLAVEPVLNTYTATFTTNAEWEKVYAYAWSGEGENVEEFLGGWPGTELTATDGVYTVTIEAKDAPQFIVFNNGNSGEGNQTGDLAFESGKAYDYTVGPQLLVLPDGVELATYTLTASTDQYINNVLTRDVVVEKSVQVGFKDDKMYIQGLNPNNEEAWIEGSVSEDGNKVIFLSNQLINLDPMEWLRFEYSDGWAHEEDPNYPDDPDMVFSYDRIHGVLTTDFAAFISTSEDIKDVYNAPVSRYWYNNMTLTAPVPDYTLGDVNADGLVTTTDAVMAVDFALERSVPTQAQFLAADVVKSDAITITDAVAIVNMALELPNPNDELTGARMLTGCNYLTMNGQTVNLTNDIDFAGFQMDVTLADGALLNGVELTERASGMMLGYNRIGDNTWRIVALSLDNKTISGNNGALLKLDIMGNSTISVTNIEFADTAARAYRLDVNGEATGISGIYGVSSDADIYNVNGVRTNTMQKGVNIIRNSNGKVQKVFVK